MNKAYVVVIVLAVFGVGLLYVSNQTPSSENTEEGRNVVQESRAVVLPIAEYVQRRTFNGFGEFSQGTLAGYHVAEDIEYTDVLNEEVPVVSIAPGVVRRIGQAAGYGGVLVVAHTIGEREVNAIYGHIDLSSSPLQQGEAVEKGEFLANLGDHESQETDGERKHLHFGLYEGGEMRIQGYEPTAPLVGTWINPNDFFQEQGYDMQSPSRTFDPNSELGGDVYPLEFRIPEGWEIEYVQAQDALNLYSLAGEGTALERSQIFIQHFDAADFLTLSTVTIHRIQDGVVGKNYTARRYDIEKKPAAPSFSGQPSWRNLRHTATDFRGQTGFTRYFTVASHPGLDTSIYETILASMNIVE